MTDCPMLFFGGGSALSETAAELARLHEYTVHLVPPFDSGGSTAELRRVFSMPAVGDMRARLLALAPPSPLADLCRYRLSCRSAVEAAAELNAIIEGKHRFFQTPSNDGSDGIAADIRDLLIYMRGCLPSDFDMRAACLGNLLLTALYLMHGRSSESASDMFGRYVGSFGIVRLSSDDHAGLSARLADGTSVVGQHIFTGKQYPPITSSIENIRLIRVDKESAEIVVSPYIRQLIRLAGMIVYSVGSFYSSVAAHFLIAGMGDAVRSNPCKKVLIPNAVPDPESPGYTVCDYADRLSRMTEVTHILTDTRFDYYGGISEDALRKRRISLIRMPIMTPDGRLIPKAVIAALRALQAEK